jgi:hypothetical protein
MTTYHRSNRQNYLHSTVAHIINSHGVSFFFLPCMQMHVLTDDCANQRDPHTYLPIQVRKVRKTKTYQRREMEKLKLKLKSDLPVTRYRRGVRWWLGFASYGICAVRPALAC